MAASRAAAFSIGAATGYANVGARSTAIGVFG